MLITEQILKEAEEFSEDLTSAIFDTMDDYQACDFEDEEDYAESIIDYTLGRLGYDIMDDDNSEEYDELYEIALRNFGPTLMIFYQQICDEDEKENPLD